MGVHKIAQFYDDPRKRAYDRRALKASERGRSIALETSPRWRALRLFTYCVVFWRIRLRALRAQMSAGD